MADPDDSVDDELVKDDDETSAAGAGGTITVRREFLEGGKTLSETIDDYDEEDVPAIAVRRFVSPPARVMVAHSATVNMGNYESVKVTVGITLPCYPVEVDDCYTFADEWVSAKLLKEVAAARGSKAGKKAKVTEVDDDEEEKPARKSFFKTGKR